MNILKHTLMICAFLAATAQAHFGAFDVVVNAQEMRYAPDLSSVRLVAPTILLKHPQGHPVTERVSSEKLASFWSPQNRQGNYFAHVHPNARLSAWDHNGHMLQSDFVITSATHDHGDLILTIAPLDKHLQAMPTNINDIKVTTGHVRQITEKSERANITVLIDCAGPFDSRCR